MCTFVHFLPMSLSVVILLLKRGAIADSLDTDGKVLLYMYMYMHTCTMYNYTCTCIYCTCTIIIIYIGHVHCILC